MEGDGGLLHTWNEWGIHALVLASFGLQVFLLLCGDIRRRISTVVLRIALWLAYLLADSTAIYTLGHLSVASWSGERNLVAFWAPFLLLHLGGPDNITAYALEDNSLWLRHLQTLVVQVLGAAYVIYKYIATADDEIFLPLASISMFVVGVLKYGERTWALKCGNMNIIAGSIDKKGVDPYGLLREGMSEEEILLRAHSQFNICKSAFTDVTLRGNPLVSGSTSVSCPLVPYNSREDIYKLVEMELSLMFDILYTKAAVIHTWYGFCIHFISLLGTATAFLLFQLCVTRGGYNRVDMTISYVLLVGALVLEALSLIRAVLSTWTCWFLYNSGWEWLLHIIISLRRFVQAARSRLWKCSIGQCNLLDMCARDKTKLGYRLAKKIGIEDLWNKLHFRDTPPLQFATYEEFKMVVLQALLPLKNMGTESNSRGSFILKEMGVYKDLARWSVNIDFDESILIWHIATFVYILKARDGYVLPDSRILLESTQALSNYMMFLLVEKPDMLPGHMRRSVYHETCEELDKQWRELDKKWRELDKQWSEGFSSIVGLRRASDAETFALWLQGYYQRMKGLRPSEQNTGLFREHAVMSGVLLAMEILDLNVSGIDLIFGVWIEMMLYAADRCSRDSHARHLSNGGEFITIMWLVVRHQKYFLQCRRSRAQQHWAKLRNMVRSSLPQLLSQLQSGETKSGSAAANPATASVLSGTCS